MKKNIYIIANAAVFRSMSGGSMNFIEIAKRFARDGNFVHVITNPVGKSIYEENGLTDVNYILTDQDSKETNDPIKIFLIYIKRAFQTNDTIRGIIKRFPNENRTFIFTSEFYCDILCFMSLTKEKKY